MDEERIKNDEDELHYFGFSSTRFISEFRQRVRKDVQVILDEMKNKLFSEDVSESESIEKEMNLIYDEYMTVFEDLMLVLEPEVRKFFAIPKAALPSLVLQSKYSTPNKDVDDMEKELEELEKAYLKEQTFQHLLKLELEHLNSLKPIYNQINMILQNKLQHKQVPTESKKVEKILKPYSEFVNDLIDDTNEISVNVCDYYNKFA